MNKKNYLAIVLVLLSILISCNPEDEKEETQNLDPQVVTIDATIGPDGGVNLLGSYNSNKNTISEIGFEYAVDSLFRNTIKINAQIGSTDEIDYFIANGLEDNVNYYYKAFVISSGKSFFGDTKSFLSNGSVAPEIRSISNDYGHISDTLEILGNYFKDTKYQTFVNFSGINSQIISLNDTLIKCRVPSNISAIVNEVRVRIDNRADTYSSFTLLEPTIETIEPITGVIGDTLTLNGEHYDIVNSGNNVFFGNTQSNVIESNREFVKVIVPENIESTTASIKLNAQLQDVTYNTLFKLSAPEINTISPLNATFRDEITIEGTNFDYELSRNKVYFGTVEAVIKYADKNTLVVTVPDDLESSSEPIKVKAQRQEVVFDKNFQLIPPQINSVPTNIFTNEDLVINGAYFHPVLDKNKLMIENIPANLNSGTTTTLKTKMPLGPYPRRKAKITLQLLDLTVEYELDVIIEDKWIMVSNTLPFYYSGAENHIAVANNEVFVLAPSRDEIAEIPTLYFWKFNISDYSWKKISIPASITGWASMVSNDSQIFIYGADKENRFWEYHTVTNQFTQKVSFPGKRRDDSSSFAIGGEIYIGLGADFEPYTSIPYNDFYKYSPVTNSWSRIADFGGPSNRTRTSSFTIDNIGYVGGGANSTGIPDYWSYQPNSNEWIRIADFTDSRRDTASFALNGLGYVTGGVNIGGSNTADCWIYNPATNSWRKGEDVGHIARGQHFAFSVNGRGFVGGGGIYSGGSNGFDLYEFIP